MNRKTERTLLLTGWWWRPQFPDDAIPGTAHILPDGRVEIQFLDCFREGREQPKDNYRPVSMSLPELIGKGWGPRKCFLFDVSYHEVHPFFDNKAKRAGTAFSSRFIHGAEQHLEEPHCIREAYIEIEGLFKWIGKDLKEKDWDDKSVLIHLPLQKTVDGLRVGWENWRVEFILRNDGGFSPNRVDFKSRVFVRLQSEEGLPHKNFVDTTRLLCSFFSLALNRWTWISDIQVSDRIYSHDDSKTWMRTGKFRDTELPIMEQGLVTRAPDQEVLLEINDVRDRFQTILENWVDKYTVVGRVYDLYFSVESAPFMYLETEFLSYVRALEGFFRWKYPNSRYVDQTKFVEWIDQNIAPLFEKSFNHKKGKELTKNTIRGLKTMSNRWALEVMLKKIINRRSISYINRILSSVSLPECKEQKKEPIATMFADRIANTRNILSHGLPPDCKTLDSSSPEFRQAIKFLRILLQATLLEIAGFQKEQIDSILANRHSSPL